MTILNDLLAIVDAAKSIPPFAVSIRMHPEAISALRNNVPTALGGPQPLAVKVDACSYLEKHAAVIEMSDGTFRTVDMRPRVKQSTHDLRGMLKGARKRLRRARKAALAQWSSVPYDRAKTAALDAAEDAARDAFHKAAERVGIALQQRSRR